MSKLTPWTSQLPSVSSATAAVSPRLLRSYLRAKRLMLSESAPENSTTERLGQQRGNHLWELRASLGLIRSDGNDPPTGRAIPCTHSLTIADESRPNPTAHLAGAS